MSDDYLWDRSGPPDPDVKQLEDLLAPLGHDAPLDELRVRRRRRRLLPWIAGIVAAAAAVLAVVLAWPRGDGGGGGACPGFAYTTGAGSGGTLCVGATLETGTDMAELRIANIGRAQLGANTSVRLDRTGTDAHHITLDHGNMYAKVNAPPRLFQVTTPASEVTDLGCEYTIKIDADGTGMIEVITGQVELATKSGAIITAAAGTYVRLKAGRQPGLPVVGNTTRGFVDAVERYERGEAAAIDDMLRRAAQLDALTIANLALLESARRRDILERLAVLAPPPLGVTIDNATSDPAKLQRWVDDVRGEQQARVEH